LTTLPITQLRLYFASSLARAPRHRSSTGLTLIVSSHNDTHDDKLADHLSLFKQRM
jgi:hypothetical protein